MTRGKCHDSASKHDTGSAFNAEGSNVVDFWTYRHQRQAHLAGRDSHDAHVNAILGCIAYLRVCRPSITARTDPLLHLRFGLGLRRVALERAVRALDAGPGKEPRSAELLALITLLSSRLSAIPGTDPAYLHSLAEDLRALCSDLTDGLYSLLVSSAPQASGGHRRASPAAPD